MISKISQPVMKATILAGWCVCAAVGFSQSTLPTHASTRDSAQNHTTTPPLTSPLTSPQTKPPSLQHQYAGALLVPLVPGALVLPRVSPLFARSISAANNKVWMPLATKVVAKVAAGGWFAGYVLNKLHWWPSHQNLFSHSSTNLFPHSNHSSKHTLADALASKTIAGKGSEITEKMQGGKPDPRNVPPLVTKHDDNEQDSYTLSSRSASSESSHSHGHNQELHSGELLQAQARVSFERFSLKEHYYDKDTPQHMDLIKLIHRYEKSSLTQSASSFAKLAPKTSTQKWIKDLQRHFLHSQLESFKELHIFLNMLYNRVGHYEHFLAKIYQESPEHIHARKQELLARLRSFGATTSRRYGALQKTIRHKRELLHLLDTMQLFELHSRLQTLNTTKFPNLIGFENTRLHMGKIQKSHILEFLHILPRVYEKSLFINHILQLSDTPPLTTAKEIEALKRVKESFLIFSNKLTTRNHHKEHTHLLTDYSVATDADIKQSLLHMTAEGKRIIPHIYAQNIGKQHIDEFLQKLDDHESQKIFLWLLTEKPSYTLSDSSEKSMDVQKIVQEKNQLARKFVAFLKSKQLFKRKTPELSLHELENIYQTLSSTEILNRIRKVKVYKDLELEKLAHFNTQTLQNFIDRFIQSSTHKHIFYTYMVGLDTPTIAFMADYHPKHSVHTMEKLRLSLSRKLREMFEVGVEVVSNTNHPLIQSTLDFPSLKQAYENLMKQDISEIKKRVKTFLNTYSVKKQTFPYLNKQHLQYFHDHVLDSDFKKHLFYSIILRLDQATKKHVYILHGKKPSNTKKTKIVVKNKLLELTTQGTVLRKPVKELLITEKNYGYEDFYQKYSQMSHKAIKSILTKELTEYFSPRYYSSEELERYTTAISQIAIQHLQEWSYYVLQADEVKWMIYLTQILKLGNISGLQLAQKYYSDPTTISTQKKDMILRLMDTVIANPTGTNSSRLLPLSPTPLTSLEELWQLHDSLSHEDLVARIHKRLLPLHKEYHTSPEEIPISADDITELRNTVLDNPTKEHIYLSSILILDTFHDRDMAARYNMGFHVLRKKISKLQESLYLFFNKDFDYFDHSANTQISTIQEDFQAADREFAALAKQDIIRLLQDAEILSSYDYAKTYLTEESLDTFLRFLHEKQSSRHDTLLWHVFYCLILKICSNTATDLVFGYNVKKGRIDVLYRYIARSLRYTMFSMYPKLRVRLESTQDISKFARRPASYALQGILLEVGTLQRHLHSFRNTHALQWFEHLHLPKQDGSNADIAVTIDTKIMDIFLTSSLVTDLEWHVFFYLILRLDYTTPEHLANVYKVAALEISTTKTEILKRLRTIAEATSTIPDNQKLYTYLQDQEMIRNPLGVMKDSHALLWQLRERYYKMETIPMLRRLLAYNPSLVLEGQPISLKQITDPEAIRTHMETHMRYDLYMWHMFLSQFLRLDKNQTANLNRRYQHHPKYAYTTKKRIATILQHLFKAQLTTNP